MFDFSVGKLLAEKIGIIVFSFGCQFEIVSSKANPVVRELSDTSSALAGALLLTLIRLGREDRMPSIHLPMS